MSKVFLLPIDHQVEEPELSLQLERLFQKAEVDRVFSQNDLTALKLHVGEPGTKTFVKPKVVAALVRLITKTGAKPFLTDSAVLYRSPRDNGPSHIEVAHRHGFSLEAVGAPFVPADGVIGSDEIEVHVGGRHYESVWVASAIRNARSMLVLSHATGHLGTGLGAALKNLGMGCASKKSKLRMHHGQQPRIAKKHCIACAVCSEWCPSDAISVDEFAVIDRKRCIGCGECIAVCQEGAVKFGWGIMGKELQERVVEHAKAVVENKPNHIAYITVAQQITKDCDCLGLDQPPLLEDIGILASKDPVAIDQATLDLIKARANRTLESMSYPAHDGTIQIRYAEELGLGSSSYELELLDR